MNNREVAHEEWAPSADDLLPGHWLVLRRGERHTAVVKVLRSPSPLLRDVGTRDTLLLGPVLRKSVVPTALDHLLLGVTDCPIASLHSDLFTAKI
ncbi:hypothetical protein E1202_15640 [Saccharopolyspora karakumensis]|uniref:Uncharacterized protein n=1 Tax=Saccharopolyspora karakumensis TaxID=2530386 RepID=A0A4R5BP94_9PSEU|nr:hypothetical protein [Saccharopolyspora karakumensis]TDD87729.1 hypothetical protein E1202_15640 [Saccharopolyspora karakumensis]